MTRKIIIVVLSFILVGTLVLTGLKERTILVVEDQKTGEKVVFYPNDNRFELGYIHSVLLTPVDEYFEITEDNQLLLQKTIYESFGVGLPYEQENDADFEIIDGKFVLYMSRNFSEVNMVISPIPKHTITVNGEVSLILDLFNDKSVPISDNTIIKTENKPKTIKIFVESKKVFEIGSYHVVL